MMTGDDDGENDLGVYVLHRLEYPISEVRVGDMSHD